MSDQLDSYPVVTIVTVTYNSEKYVKSAIDSVLSQDYNNIEYIILDDGSSDNTWNLINSYTDSRIRAFRNSKNLGEYNNRNKGIDLATGKYLIFIDGDDFIYPHAISFFTKMMEAFPDSGMAISRNYENNILYPVELYPLQTISSHYFSRSILAVSFVSTFFKTEILRNVGGVSNLYRTGDEYIRLLIGSKYNTLLVNYGLTWHRETPGQATRLVSESGIGLAEEWKMFKFLRSNEILPLSYDQLNSKEQALKKRLARFLLKNLFLLKFRKFMKVFSLTEFKVKDLFFAFKNVKNSVGYLNQYSPENPLKLELNKNPFSRNFINNAGNS